MNTASNDTPLRATLHLTEQHHMRCKREQKKHKTRKAINQPGIVEICIVQKKLHLATRNLF